MFTRFRPISLPLGRHARRRGPSILYHSLSSAECDAFARDGFVIVRNLLSAEEVDVVRQAIEQDASLSDAGNTILLNDEAGGHTQLNLWSKPGDGALGLLVRSQRVVGAMEKLLARPMADEARCDVVHYHSKTLNKEPNRGGVWNWHQDYGYWYKDFFLTPDMLTAYFAIDRQTMDNGCIKLLKGLTWPSP